MTTKKFQIIHLPTGYWLLYTCSPYRNRESPLHLAQFGVQGYPANWASTREKKIHSFKCRIQREPKLSKYINYTDTQIEKLFYRKPMSCNKDTLNWLFPYFQPVIPGYPKFFKFNKAEFALIPLDSNGVPTV